MGLGRLRVVLLAVATVTATFGIVAASTAPVSSTAILEEEDPDERGLDEARRTLDAFSSALDHRPPLHASADCQLEVRDPTGFTQSTGCGSSPQATTETQGNSTNASGGQAPAIQFEETAVLETPRWFASVRSIDGLGSGTHARVHGFGEVSVVDEDGEFVWRRTARSFYEDWPQLAPEAVPYVQIGALPSNPLVVATENSYALEDVTGDGVEDIAVTHLARFQEDPVPSSDMSPVTVLDGATGETLWFEAFEGTVSQLELQGSQLFIAHDTGSTLSGWNLSTDGSELLGQKAWTLERPTDGEAQWLDLQTTPGGLLVATWTDKELGEAGLAGVVTAIDPADGDVSWTTPTGGYPADVRADESRQSLLVHEQEDPLEPLTGEQVDSPVRGTNGYEISFAYNLSAIDLETGERTVQHTREDAILTNLAVANTTGDAQAEWLTTDFETSDIPANQPPLFRRPVPEQIEAGRVTVTQPGASAPVWEYRNATGTYLPYGLEVAGENVLVGSFETTAAHHVLRAFDAGTGDEDWTQSPEAGFPLFMESLEDGGQRTVVQSHADVSVLTFDATDGQPTLDEPVPYEIHASAAHDVDDDGVRDLIAGGGSDTVFALDLETLGPIPNVHWEVDLGSSIHQLKLHDLTTDPGPELVVVASDAVHVLDPDDGSEHYHIDPGARMAWTVSIGDVDQDGDGDLVLPGEALRAYDGPTGEQLWSYEGQSPTGALFSPAAITGDGQVGASFFLTHQPEASSVAENRHHSGFLALDGATGDRLWRNVKLGYADRVNLWESTLHHPDIDGTEGNAIAYTWNQQGTPSAVERGSPRVDVYDAATGEQLYGHALVDGVVHMGLSYVDGLTEFNWAGTARPGPYDLQETHLGGVADLALATTADGQDVLVKSWASLAAYGPGVLDQAPAEGPDPIDRWGAGTDPAFTVGEVTIVDVDQDGSDEVLTHPFDWPAYATVASWEGRGIFHFDPDPHGLIVLELDSPKGEAT